MFVALASILAPTQALDLSITLAADGSLKVIVKPQLIKGSNPALAIPLALAATPEDMEAGFVNSLMQYAGERTSLQQQVDTTATIIAEAKATEVTKASKAINKSGAKPAATVASEAGDDHDDDNNDGDGNGNGDDTLGGDGILDGAPATSTSVPTPAAPAARPAPAPAASNHDDLLSMM